MKQIHNNAIVNTIEYNSNKYNKINETKERGYQMSFADIDPQFLDYAAQFYKQIQEHQRKEQEITKNTIIKG